MSNPQLLSIGIIFILVSAMLMMLLSSCGVTAPNQQPPPPVGVSVVPGTASVQLSATQQFVAAVTNTTNLSVTWTVNGILGGNSVLGTISSSGLYTAPQTLPQPASVTVQATSQADATASGSALITLTSPSPITVTVAPNTANVLLGATQQFAATVSNTSNTSVSWTVNGVAGGNALIGTISAAGLFTAPQVLPQQNSITVQAISQAAPSASGSATVTIVSDVAISVTPSIATVELGAVQTFTPHIVSTGNPATSATWAVSGPGCVNGACGTIDANGGYIAPGILPSPAAVTITARSVADTSKTTTATITITSHFTLNISGASSVNSGASANYSATLTPAPNSNPYTGILWSVSGSGCSGANCGTISPSGTTAAYTAPSTAPSPAIISITATPTADPTKAVSMSVTIVPQVTVVISPGAANVGLSANQQFTAQVTGTANTSTTWDVNGIVGGNSTIGTVTNISGANTATYTAPAILPSPQTVVVHAVSNAAPSVAGQATVTVTSTVALTLTPSSVSAAVAHRQPFTVSISGAANANVIWQVAGIPGGNTTVGQICVVASNPCQVVNAAPAGTVEYLAPLSVPSPNPVSLTATSQADPAQSMSAQITVLSHIVVSVSPPSVSLAPTATQLFAANVVGTTNQTVTWNITGAACSAVGSPCGTITSGGLYTAPISTPSPNAINIVATSSEDSSRTGSSSVTITSAMVITGLLPASATAGGAGSFTLQVNGGNFLPTSPGPGSVIIVGGTARTTLCATSGTCTTALTSTDLAGAGNLSVTIRNPNSTQSNSVSFVVVAASPTVDIIPLTPTNPSATGKDIIVVEPSTAGSLAPQQNVTITVAAMGLFSPAANTCSLGAGSLVITRPASGTAIVDICVFSVSGLDPSFTYSLTGPALADITIVGKQPLGLGIVDLTLAIPASALPGLRSLFVQNPNLDKAVATGALEVQ